ncbi:MAG: glycosyltransferase family 9 protein [Ignavibacteria bacterium]|nr:glycosyltransferase family 9 protein [Ignavibacteria bacterium]
MKILIIQTAFAGDAILTLPMIQVLKKKHTNSLIDVLCIPATSEIFDASPAVNSSIVVDKKGAQKKFFSFIKFIKKLKTANYNKIYSPHRSFRSAFIVWLLHVKDSVGFSNSSIPFIFNEVVEYDSSAHEVLRNLNLIDVGLKDDNWKIQPEIIVSDFSKEKVKNFLSENKLTRFISVAVGSVWETKKYPLEYYKSIVKHFIDDDYKIVLIGGAEDKRLCDELEDENTINTAGMFSFVETTELLKRTKLLICNDSAPTHLGMCADIPVLTIYCSTAPAFGFYPYNSRSNHLSYNELTCKPCGIHGHNECPIGTFDCGKLLKPEIVIEKAKSLLEKNGR